MSRIANSERGPEGAPRTERKKYLSIGDLSEITPWTPDAIRAKIRRGTFKKGVHYFQPEGPGSQWIFSWPAIVRHIEGQGTNEHNPASNHDFDITAAAEAATRLLG